MRTVRALTAILITTLTLGPIAMCADSGVRSRLSHHRCGCTNHSLPALLGADLRLRPRHPLAARELSRRSAHREGGDGFRIDPLPRDLPRRSWPLRSRPQDHRVCADCGPGRDGCATMLPFTTSPTSTRSTTACSRGTCALTSNSASCRRRWRRIRPRCIRSGTRRTSRRRRTMRSGTR